MTGVVRSVLMLVAAAAASSLACQSTPAPGAGPLPLGPGPERQLDIAEVTNVAPSMATRAPFVAIAWTAGRPGGDGGVYVVTSADNGATFSTPTRVGETQMDAEHSAVVVFEWPLLDDQFRLLMPDVRVEWTFQARGRVERRAARSTDHGRTFVRDPDDRVQLFYTGAPDAPSLAIDRVVGTQDRERLAIDHAQVAPQEDGTIVAVWDQAHGDARRVMLRRVLPSKDGSVQTMDAFPLSASTSGTAPVLGAVNGGVITAWTSGGPSSSVIAVRRVGLDAFCGDAPRLEFQPFGHLDHD